MKIILPSLGLYGARSVDMSLPTFKDLRAVHSMNIDCEPLVKVQFVKQLCPDIDLSKITKCDLDYLFAVAALSISYNQITLRIDCPECGESFSHDFKFYEKEIATIDKKIKGPVVRTINDVDYSFHVLTGQNELDAIEYAMAEDNFDEAYQDAIACFTFGKSLADIDEVTALPGSIFLTAFIFQQCCFHGFENTEYLKCPHCGKEIYTRAELPSSLIRISLDELTSQYTRVSDQVTFDSFLNFTIPEFKSLVEALNNQI